MNQNTAETTPSQHIPEADLLKPANVEVGIDTEFPQENEQGSRDIEIQKGQQQQKEKTKISLPKIKKRAVLPIMPRDEITIKVEKILAEGLEEDYKKLPPIVQQEFKLKGEQTASKIGELLKTTKVKIKSIFRLILEWLSLLPNVNRFFLEQEAKIKTDHILNLKK